MKLACLQNNPRLAAVDALALPGLRSINADVRFEVRPVGYKAHTVISGRACS